MTILEIQLLTHIHAYNEPWPHSKSPAYLAALHKFIRLGLVVMNDVSASGYRTTETGDNIVACLKSVALD